MIFALIGILVMLGDANDALSVPWWIYFLLGGCTLMELDREL